MAWQDHKINIEGIRKVKWNGLWHVLYNIPLKEDKYRETYDRVDKKTAIRVLKIMEKNA